MSIVIKLCLASTINKEKAPVFLIIFKSFNFIKCLKLQTIELKQVVLLLDICIGDTARLELVFPLGESTIKNLHPVMTHCLKHPSSSIAPPLHHASLV